MKRHQVGSCHRQEHDAVVGYVARRRPRDAVDDVVAEVFAAVWQGRSRVPAPTERRPWLYGIARHQVAAAQRAHRNHQLGLTAWAAVLAGVPVAAPDAEIQVLDVE